GELELAAGLERDRAAPGRVEQTDNVGGFQDRLPTERTLHAFEQRPDAAVALIRHRPMALDREGEFLVLGAEAKLRLRLDAGLEPRDELIARLDRRQVDLVTSHMGKTGGTGGDLIRAAGEEATT